MESESLKNNEQFKNANDLSMKSHQSAICSKIVSQNGSTPRQNQFYEDRSSQEIQQEKQAKSFINDQQSIDILNSSIRQNQQEQGSQNNLEVEYSFFDESQVDSEEQQSQIILPIQPEESNSSQPEILNQHLIIRQLRVLSKRLEFSQWVFLLLSVYFFVLSVLSLIEFFIIYRTKDVNEWFVLFSILQNCFHTYFFSIEMFQLVVRKRAQMQNPMDSIHILNQILMNFSDLGISSVLYYLIKKKYELFKINQTIFTIIYIYGSIKLFSQNNEIQLWYLVAQLSLGFMFYGLMTLLSLIACILTPFTLCCTFRFFGHNDRDNSQDFQDLMEDPPQIVLPPSVAFNSLKKLVVQPCYICLQDYEQIEMVIELPCHAKHIFHEECIQPWIDLHPHCPVCREKFH